MQPSPKSLMPHLCGSDSLAAESTTLSRAQVGVLADNGLGLLNDLLTLGKDQLDVAGVRHVGVDLYVESVLVFFVCQDRISFNIHDRGHGKYVCAAWGPG